MLYGVRDKHILDFHFPSMKMAVFVDGNGKMGVSSMKRAVFVDGSSGYLLYLHDLNENLN